MATMEAMEKEHGFFSHSSVSVLMRQHIRVCHKVLRT